MVFCIFSNNFKEEKEKYLDDFMLKRLDENIENENFIKKSNKLIAHPELRYFRISVFRFIFSEIGYKKYLFLEIMKRKKDYDKKEMQKVDTLRLKELKKIRNNKDYVKKLLLNPN